MEQLIISMFDTYGHLLLGFIIFIEIAILFILPGESLVFAISAMEGASHKPLIPIIIASFIGTYFGGMVAYYIGDKIEDYKDSVYLRHMLKRDNLSKAEEFFNRYGKTVILFARFVPGIRTFIFVVAGISSMQKKTFHKYNLAGAIIWSFTIPILGYFIGKEYPGIIPIIQIVIVTILLVTISPFLLPKSLQSKLKHKIKAFRA